MLFHLSAGSGMGVHSFCWLGLVLCTEVLGGLCREREREREVKYGSVKGRIEGVVVNAKKIDDPVTDIIISSL